MGAELLKVERQRAKLNSRESLAESVKRIGRLESSSLVVTRLGRTCDECAAFSRCYRAQRGKRNPPETGSLNQEARDKRIFLFEETGLAVFKRVHCEKGRKEKAGTPVVRGISFSFFLLFEVGKIKARVGRSLFFSTAKRKKGKKEKPINSKAKLCTFRPVFVDGSFADRVN